MAGPALPVCLAGRLPPAGTDGGNYPSFRANSAPAASLGRVPWSAWRAGPRCSRAAEGKILLFFRGKSVGERERGDVDKMDGFGRRRRGNVLVGLCVADSPNDRSTLEGSDALYEPLVLRSEKTNSSGC